MKNYNYELVPNQRSVRVNKKETNKKSATNYYAAINLIALETARKILSPNSFKFWTYLAQNQNGYEFALSRVDTMNSCGFGKNTYDKVFAELCDKYYLVKSAEGNTHYDFYEMPHDNTNVTVRINKI